MCGPFWWKAAIRADQLLYVTRYGGDMDATRKTSHLDRAADTLVWGHRGTTLHESTAETSRRLLATQQYYGI